MERGADLTKRSSEGDNAFGIAELHGHSFMAEFLRQAGCDDGMNARREEQKLAATQWLAEAVKLSPPPSTEALAMPELPEPEPEPEPEPPTTPTSSFISLDAARCCSPPDGGGPLSPDYTSAASDVARKLDLPEAVPPPPAAGADG